MPNPEEAANSAPRADVEGEPNKPRKPYRKPTDAHPHIPRGGFRITEWCARYNFGRSHFYELQKKKKGPRVTDVGGIKIVTIEDDAAWRKERARDAA